MYIKQLLFSLYLFFSTLNGFTQNIDNQLPLKEINTAYLEHLVKINIDSVRLAHQLTPLLNDSILYLASKHHSDYMTVHSVLSHSEKSNSHKTPQKRVESFHGKAYLVGENILFTFFNRPISSKKGAEKLTTYKALAKHMVENWVNSPGHYKNIITPSYELTGVSVSINYSKNKIYATQKFGWKKDQIHYPAFPKLFPFDAYRTPKKITSFPTERRENHSHLFNLQHGSNTEECASCDSLLNNSPQMSLSFKNKTFRLKIENSEYVKTLINNKNDGFAIEIVEFKDYHCNNSAYYTKPSRRNKQCDLNGKPLKPIYRNRIYKGFKKRKRKKDFKFIPYLFAKNSIPFFQRIKRFQIDKYSSEYCEFNLGSNPILKSEHWAYNLLIIKNNKICKTIYFSKNCGELYSEAIPLQTYIPDTANSPYTFNPMSEVFVQDIAFNPGETKIPSNILHNYKNTLKQNAYELDSLLVFCFASVEGDSLENIKIQQERAKNIRQALNHAKISGKNNLEFVKTNWPHFNAYVKQSKCWNFLNRVDPKTRKEYINEVYKKELEPILKAGRTSFVRFVNNIPLTNANLTHYIQYENKSLIDSLYKFKNDPSTSKTYNKKLFNLYRFTFKHVMAKTIDQSIIETFVLPQINMLPQKTKELKVLYDFYFQNSTTPSRSTKVWIDHIDDMHRNTLSSEYVYQRYYSVVEGLSKGELKWSEDKCQELISLIDASISQNPNSEINPLFSSMVTNINYHLLNQIFSKDSKGQQINALKAINQLKTYYDKTNTYTVDKAISLLKLCEFFYLEEYLQHFTSPHENDFRIQAHLLELQYWPEPITNSFYKQLIKTSHIYPKSVWCSMFIKDCKIPFQVFNNNELRQIYCEKCEEELNEIMNE